VLRAAATLGLAVPADVSVAGFDGADLPWLEPVRLTTVVQPTTEKGQAAGRAVTALMSGRMPADVVLPVWLRVGTTTGPARPAR
jgi:DNA-binding LacI/PurR family transcriptional regulator